MGNNSKNKPSVTLEPCVIPKERVLRTVQEIDKQFDIITRCFSNGVARGREEDIQSMLEAYKLKDVKISSTEIPGIFEASLRYAFEYHDGNIYLMDVINRFPSLKIAGFLETDYEVYIAFSDSGYKGITDMELAGGYDPKSEASWQWEYSPLAEITEIFQSIQTSNNIIFLYISIQRVLV